MDEVSISLDKMANTKRGWPTTYVVFNIYNENRCKWESYGLSVAKYGLKSRTPFCTYSSAYSLQLRRVVVMARQVYYYFNNLSRVKMEHQSSASLALCKGINGSHPQRFGDAQNPSWHHDIHVMTSSYLEVFFMSWLKFAHKHDCINGFS